MAIKQRRGVLAPISGAKVRQDDRVDVEQKYASNGADWISFYVWFGCRPMGLMSQCLVSSEGFKVTPAGVPGEGAVGGFSSPPKEAEGILLLVTTEFAPRTVSVDAQGGAYAMGVLVLMSSAAVAMTLSAWRKRSEARWPIASFAAIAAIFLYTTVQYRRKAERGEDSHVFHRYDCCRLAALACVAYDRAAGRKN